MEKMQEACSDEKTGNHEKNQEKGEIQNEIVAGISDSSENSISKKTDGKTLVLEY